MPPRLVSAIYTLAAIAVLWACVDYAQHMVANFQAGRWLGFAVDLVIWLLGLGMALALMRRAGGK